MAGELTADSEVRVCIHYLQKPTQRSPPRKGNCIFVKNTYPPRIFTNRLFPLSELRIIHPNRRTDSELLGLTGHLTVMRQDCTNLLLSPLFQRETRFVIYVKKMDISQFLRVKRIVN